MRIVAHIFIAFYFMARSLTPLGAQDLPEETVYVDRGVLAYSEKRYADALKELQEALRVNSASHEALYYRGLVFQELKRMEEARQALERAYRLRPQSSDIAFQLGVLYIKEQRFQDAEPLLRQVYRAEPQRPNLGFYLGLVEYRSGNFRRAIDLFRAANPSDDEFAQLARYYTGLAAAALGYPREARLELGEALRIRPGSSLAGSIPRLNEPLEQGINEEKRLHGEVRFGFVYDTNVSKVVDPSLNLSLGKGERDSIITAIEFPRRKRSTGELVSGDLSYSLLRTLDWEGVLGYRFLHVEANQAAEFTTQTHSPSLSLTKKGTVSGLPYFAGLQTIYDHIRLGHDTFLHRGTVNPFLTLLESPNNATNLQFRLQIKNFSNDSRVRPEIRDAANYMIGLAHYFLLAEGRHHLKIGYQHDRENAQGRNWSYNGDRVILGMQYTFPWHDIRFRYDFDYHWRRYRHRFTLLPGPTSVMHRKDRDAVHTASLSKDFAIGAQNFNVTIEYLYNDARSNFSIFRFTRHVVIPSIAWRF